MAMRCSPRPFLRLMRTVEACARTWPPIGFLVSPNMAAAPGSAVTCPRGAALEALESWRAEVSCGAAAWRLGGRRDAGARLVGNEDGEVVDGCQLCQPREELVERLLSRRELAAALVVDAEESRRRVDDKRAVLVFRNHCSRLVEELRLSLPW